MEGRKYLYCVNLSYSACVVPSTMVLYIVIQFPRKSFARMFFTAPIPLFSPIRSSVATVEYHELH